MLLRFLQKNAFFSQDAEYVLRHNKAIQSHLGRFQWLSKAVRVLPSQSIMTATIDAKVRLEACEAIGSEYLIAYANQLV